MPKRARRALPDLAMYLRHRRIEVHSTRACGRFGSIARLRLLAFDGCLASLIAFACTGERPAKPHSGARIATGALATFGGEDSPLFQVAGAVLLGDQVVVAERSSGTLRFYRRTGELLKAVGGRGGGPGEFRRLTWIQQVNRRLFVYDGDPPRLSEFSPDGAFLRSLRIEPLEPYTTTWAAGVFADRSILVQASRRNPLEWAASATVSRTPIALLRYDEEGTYIDSLGWYQGTEMYRQPWGRAGGLSSPLVFGRRSAVVVAGLRYYVVDNNDNRIVVYDTSGARMSELRPNGQAEPAAITKGDIDVARRRFVRGETRQLRLGPIFDKMPLPTTFPPYGWAGERRLSLLRVSQTGDVWVLNFGGVRSAQPVWTVFAENGAMRGQVTALEEVDVLDATSELLLALSWDADDVESVQLRRIVW